MNISGTLQSWGSSMYSAGSSAATSLKGYAETAVEKGKIGYNKTVTLIKDDPKAALVTGLALAAVALTAVYLCSGTTPADPTGSTGQEDPTGV